MFFIKAEKYILLYLMEFLGAKNMFYVKKKGEQNEEKILID